MQKFIIVGTPRTGSSALAQLINFHPEVLCGWEWTNNVPWWKKIQVAQAALSGDFRQLTENNRIFMEERSTSVIKYIGYRSLFRSSNKWLIHPRLCPVIWAERLKQHTRWIANNPDISIIHITRNDNLAWLKSYLFSSITKNYINKPYPEALSININRAEAIARVRSKLWLDKQLARLKNSNPYLKIKYEALDADKLDTGKLVIQFLGCKDSGYSIDESMMCSKQSKGLTSEGIENYEEISLEFSKRNLLNSQL